MLVTLGQWVSVVIFTNQIGKYFVLAPFIFPGFVIIWHAGVLDALQSVKQGWGEVFDQGQCGKSLHQDDRGGKSYHKVNQ